MRWWLAESVAGRWDEKKREFELQERNRKIKIKWSINEQCI